MIAEKIPLILIKHFMIIFDKYKNTIINKDSILELIENAEGGFTEFISRFTKICAEDIYLLQIINKKGLEKFV